MCTRPFSHHHSLKHYHLFSLSFSLFYFSSFCYSLGFWQFVCCFSLIFLYLAYVWRTGNLRPDDPSMCHWALDSWLHSQSRKESKASPVTKILVSLCEGVGSWQWHKQSGDNLDLRSQDRLCTLGILMRKYVAKFKEILLGFLLSFTFRCFFTRWDSFKILKTWKKCK